MDVYFAISRKKFDVCHEYVMMKFFLKAIQLLLVFANILIPDCQEHSAPFNDSRASNFWLRDAPLEKKYA